MQDFIDDFVELVEDLVDLRVVSVAVGRLSALLQGGGGGARHYNVEMLERRRGMLEKLSQKLTGQSGDASELEQLSPMSELYDADGQSGDASELEQLSPTSELYDADPQGEFDADLYVPEEMVYYDPSESNDAGQIPGGADQVPEDPAQAPENAAQAPQDVAEAPQDSASPVHAEGKAANSFFNELFPTEAVTKQHQLDGSFPDFADFSGGIDCVGSGFSGLVFKSTLRGVPVVLKVSRAKSEAANRADYTEWSVSEGLNPHPNVLQVVGLCPSFGRALSQEDRTIAFGNTVIDTTAIGTTAIVSRWQENGALRTFYDSKTRIRKDDDLQNAALGMIRGVRSLHEQGVVHRDIAVRNFLVDIDGRVMLCDFGLTRSIPDGKKQIDLHDTPDLLPWRYLAPECFDGIYSTASDMWMYGVSLVELVRCVRPWQDIEQPAELRKAMKTRELELPAMADFPEIIASIVRDCLQFEPSMRPTANDVAERLVRWQFHAMDLNRDDNGNTPLHRAASSADDSGVQLLGSQIPAMVNAVNHLGETPLMLAKNSIFVERLLAYRKVPSSNEEPSRISECYHNIDAFGTLWKLTKTTSFKQIKLIGTYGNLQRTDFDERVGPNGETPLHVAAEIGSIELFDALVGLNVISVWKSDNDRRTALHVASQHGHAIIIEKLVALTHESEEKSDVEVHRVNMQDKTGKTALHLAAASGNASAVRVLLDCSATNVNLRDFDGRVQMFDVTLAIDAGELSQVEVLQSFVKHPLIDLLAKDSAGETLLHKVARNDLTQAAEFLLQVPEMHTNMYLRENEHNFAPIHLAVHEKSFRVAATLLYKWDRDINERDEHGNSLLHMLAAAYISRTDASYKQILIERSAMKTFAETLVSRESIDLNLCNTRGETPLRVAIDHNNLTVVEVLFAAPDGKLLINQCDKADVVELLFSKSDDDANDADDLGRTPLHSACYNNMTAMAQVIMSNNDVNVNARDKEKRTPLHLACLKNAAEVAALLLERDEVDVNARDEGQRTPLHVASWENADKVANMLIQRDDVDANAREEDEDTPLHVASWKNAVEVAKVLLSRNDVDVNARDKLKETPLHLASLDNDAAEVVTLLLSRYDVGACDYQGKTALERAVERGRTRCVEVIRTKYGKRFAGRRH